MGGGLAVVFDLDGTLVDPSTRHHTVYAELAGSFGGQPLDKPAYWRLKRAGTGWPEILVESGLPADRTPLFLDRFRHEIERRKWLALDTIFPGADDVLQSLQRRHGLYLATLRRSPAALRWQLGALGLNGRFRAVATAPAQGNASDQKASLVRHAIGQQHGVMVGDTEVDVLAARALGLAAVAVSSGIREEEYLAQLDPDFLLVDLAPLPGLLGAIARGRA